MAALSSTLATVSLASQAAGAVTSTIGAYSSAQSQRSTLLTQASIAESNARIAEMGAQSELLQGQREVGRLTLRAGQLKSRQRVALAANGVALGEGSAAELQASTDLMKEIDRNTVEANAVNAAWGRRTQATNFRNEARTARGTAGAINPLLSAGTTLLSGAGSVAQSWYALDKAGAFNAPSTGQIGDPIKAMGELNNWWS